MLTTTRVGSPNPLCPPPRPKKSLQTFRQKITLRLRYFRQKSSPQNHHAKIITQNFRQNEREYCNTKFIILKTVARHSYKFLMLQNFMFVSSTVYTLTHPPPPPHSPPPHSPPPHSPPPHSPPHLPYHYSHHETTFLRFSSYKST